MPREHEITIRVRYCETDAMQYLHHSHYVNYCEMGRTEMLRASGGDYRAMEERGLFLVVVKFACKYHQPAHYDDEITLQTRVARVTPAKLQHTYRFLRDGQLLAEAESTLACVNAEGQVQRMTEALKGFLD